MERMPMCRLCLVENVRMYIVVDKDLHELYETLTDIPFVTEDRRPALACFLCFAKLKQCLQLRRKCLEAEKVFARMMNEPNYLVNRGQLEYSRGLTITPVKNISIVDDSHIERIAVKEELPAVCERLDNVIELEEEHHSNDVELVNVCMTYSDVGDTPALRCSETDTKHEMFLLELELKTELDEELVLPKKRRTSDTTTWAPDVKRSKLETRRTERYDVITAQRTEQPETRVVRTCGHGAFRPGAELEEPSTRSKSNEGYVKHQILKKVPVPSTLESYIPPEEDTISPAMTSPRTKKCILQSLLSTGTLQSGEPAPSPVGAEIELSGCTPSSTTSKTAPDFGKSASKIDMERDFTEPGDGSDVEPDEHLDITLEPRNVYDETLEDQSLAEAMQQIDTAADSALRSVVGPEQDLLHFDWRNDPENFEGLREEFTVPSTGPTFPNAELTPLDVFLKIWDADIVAHIVRETNRYGGEMMERNRKPHSRMSRWKEVTDDDIRKFFAIIMVQSLVVNKVEREYWYPKCEELRFGDLKTIMPYNRYLVIKRCLHFVDNASLPGHPNRLHKIMPIIDYLNNKFSSLYILEQNVALDESLFSWKGRLSFSQKIASKKAPVGIKSYELCESRTGYLWRMEVYSGKARAHVARTVQEPVEQHEVGDSATSQIVLTLMRPLLNRGHTLVMDNFYNSPLLSRLLKVKHKTDSMGNLRLSREFVPEGLQAKNMTNMKSGEMVFSTTKDLSVVVWMDNIIVSMISTFHQVGEKDEHGYYKKPQVILDYNHAMGGIDHKDQMLHAYPIERVRNGIWYKKLFRRLLNVSIHNAFVMFNHNRTQSLGNRDFRLQLALGLLQMCRSRPLPRPLPPAPPAAPAQTHVPVKNVRRQRCKLCYAAKMYRLTVWMCNTCAVNLCIKGCFNAYHQRKDNLFGFTGTG